MNTLANLIHIARIFSRDSGKQTLYLRRSETAHYHWVFVDQNNQESSTPVSADSAEEAIRLAKRHWRNDAFETLRCGFRFTLPERDEIGSNALFHQMVASYSTMNGIYLDEELGHQCIVHEASLEALNHWTRLRSHSRCA